MKTRNMFLAVLLIICMICMMLTGCGSTSESSEETASEAAASTEETVQAEQSSEAESVTETAESNAADATEDTATEQTEQAASAEEEVEEESPTLSFPLTDSGEELSLFYYYPPFVTNYVDSVGEISFFQQMEELTGVHINFTECSLLTVDENFMLMIASGDYTDMVYGFAGYYSLGVDNAITDEIIYPLNEYMESGFMPNYTALLNSNSELLLNATTDEGYVPVAAQILSDDYKSNAGMIIRQDFLEAVGMDSPVTYDDYYEVLTAFKNELGLEAPLNIPYYGTIPGNYLSAGFGVATYGASQGGDVLGFYVVDGEVKLGLLEDEYYEWLALMAQWYSEGLIWSDFATATDVINYPSEDRVIAGKTGIWYCDIDTMGGYASLTDDENFRVVGVADPVQNEGDVNHLRKFEDADANLVNLTNGVAITTACENPELAAMWLDAHYSEEGSMIVNYGGLEGETYEVEADGSIVLGDLIVNNEIMSFNEALSFYCAKNYVGYYEYSRLSSTHTEDQKEAVEIWCLADTEYGYPTNVSMTEEETEAFNAISGDLTTYVEENIVKFIMGSRTADEFETFRQELISMGAEDLVAYKQAAYDRYMARSIQ